MKLQPLHAAVAIAFLACGSKTPLDVEVGGASTRSGDATDGASGGSGSEIGGGGSSNRGDASAPTIDGAKADRSDAQARADLAAAARPDRDAETRADAGFDAVTTPIESGASFEDGGATQEIDFVSLADRVDMVHDAKRQRLYISTESGHIVEYDLTAHTIASDTTIGGALRGIDLSPSEDTLVVANTTVTAGQNEIDVVDLLTRTTRRINFPLEFGEFGTFTAVFIDDLNALVTSSGSGWAPMRRVRVDDGSAVELRMVRHDSMLTASAGGTAIAYCESDISSGPIGAYQTQTGQFISTETGGFLYEIAVNRSATQYAVANGAGVFMFDAQFMPLSALPLIAGQYPVSELPLTAGQWPLSAFYSPTSDRLYVAMNYQAGSGPPFEIYDTTTLSLISGIPSSRVFPPTFHAFESGRLRMSRDGSLLFATVTGGIAIYSIAP